MAETTKHPLQRTEKLSLGIISGATTDPVDLEIAKSAIAIFCKCALTWCKAAKEAKSEDSKEPKSVSIADLKAAMAKEVQETAATHILKELEVVLGENFEAEMERHHASTSGRAYLAARDTLDESTSELFNSMVGACTDITNKIVDSMEFKDDLKEIGLSI